MLLDANHLWSILYRRVHRVASCQVWPWVIETWVVFGEYVELALVAQVLALVVPRGRGRSWGRAHKGLLGPAFCS